jgi:ATP-binding protein involved in chromosome partitioning
MRAVLDLVENLSGLRCPKCGGRARRFGADGGGKTAEEMGVPSLGAISIAPEVVVSGDSGTPTVEAPPHGETVDAFGRIVRNPYEKAADARSH